MLALERRSAIIERLQSEKSVMVSELSRTYQVTEETIRRDLEKLEKEGYCTKSYGGAVLKENLALELPFNVRKNKNVVGKQRIAGLMVPLVREGESLFLDASTTAVCVARALKCYESLTVVTNSMEILLELSDRPEWTVVCTGGIMKSDHLAMMGGKAEEAIRSYFVDTAIVSCKALSLEKGMMESSQELLSTKKAMLASCKRRILAVDSSKFDKTSFAANPDMNGLDVVVTDERPSKEWEEFFAARQIDCLYPERNGKA